MTSVLDCPACGMTRSASSHRKCSSCGTWCKATPSDNQLAALYTSAWMSGSQGQFATGSSDLSIVAQLATAFGQPASADWVLDFGAGTGAMAGHLAATVANVFAVEPYGPDPAIAGVRWLSSIDGLPPSVRFDHIYAVEVVEHLKGPLATLESLAVLLAPGGKIHVTTPNARGANARLRGERWREAANPTHLQLFTPEGLSQLAARAGLEVVSIPRQHIDFGRSGARRQIGRLLQRLQMDGSLRMSLGLALPVRELG